VAILWIVVKQDIENAASALKSANHLADIYCGKRKSSRWVMVGQCARCTGNILYRVHAIFQNGAIVSHTHDLDNANCPHCKRSIGPDAVHHAGISRHEA
jgi:hypothetical protein